MKKIVLLLLGFTILSCVTTDDIARKRERVSKLNYTQLVREQNKIKQKDTVIIEDILFDQEEMFSAVDGNRNTLVYYERIQNSNFIISGIKLYDNNMNPVYTLLPTMDIPQKQIFIYIKDLKTGKTGRVKYQLEIDFPEILYNVDVNFFGKIYDCRLIYRADFGLFSASTALFYEGDIVMYKNASYSPTGADVDEIVVEANHMKDHAMDMTVMAFAMKLFDEIQEESIKSLMPDFLK